MSQWLQEHPEVRSGLRVAAYTFLSGFGLSLLGFLTDVAAWASSTDAVFPSVEPLGKALAAAVVAALSGLIGFFWNKLPNTRTAIYVDPKKPMRNDRGSITLQDVAMVLLVVLVLIIAVRMT